MSHLSIDDVRAEALFVSDLQRSDDPAPGEIQQAVTVAVRAFGSRGCAARTAQEFGDHPDTAVVRMQWARRMVAVAFGPVAARPTGRIGWRSAA